MACDKMKNFFLCFFTELKTYHLSSTIYSRACGVPSCLNAAVDTFSSSGGHSRRMRGIVMDLTLLGEMFLFQKHTNRIIQMEKKSNCNI